MTKNVFLLLLVNITCLTLYSQPDDFKRIADYQTTRVKNQANTGTCWCFGTLSFMESEILRQSKKEFDLSEKYVVYYVYINKAIMFVRMRGNITFTQGGYSHDAFKAIREHGIVPETAYPFNNRDHSLLEKTLKNYLDSIVKLDSLDSKWLEGYKNILNTYLGEPPIDFVYENKTITPISFYKDVLHFNPDDYIEITSFNHHDFYQQFVLEDMFNWALASYYNVPIDDLMKIVYNSIQSGYSFVWVGDVSEREFDPYSGAVELNKYQLSKKGELPDQYFRQMLYELHFTTPDHLMHVVGLYKDANGAKYFKIKNSWGSFYKYKGFMYMSENYFKYKTTNILVNKDAIPKDILPLLGRF